MYERTRIAPDVGLYPLAGRPDGHSDQLGPVADHRPALMHGTTAMGYWRDLLAIVRRVDATRAMLSRLDGSNVAGVYRQAVETELEAISHTMALQANALTVYTLQAEVARRHGTIR